MDEEGFAALVSSSADDDAVVAAMQAHLAATAGRSGDE
jgi:hypothetical protein